MPCMLVSFNLSFPCLFCDWLEHPRFDSRYSAVLLSVMPEMMIWPCDCSVSAIADFWVLAEIAGDNP